MDPNSEDRDCQHVEQDTGQYRVTYPHGRNAKEVDYEKSEESTNKRYPVNRSSSNPGRVKRVVSYKRKTRHLAVARRKQLGTGRTCDATNKENDMNCMQDMQQEIFDIGPLEFPLNVNNKHRTERTGFEQADHEFAEITKDHSTMTDVLFGRNLRLKVSLTLWQRNVGELLTYLLRIQDVGVFVDFLPLISKSIDENSHRISIGCCVDLFPLVKKVLAKPYEDYLCVALKWINSVLSNWDQELRVIGFSGSTKLPLDRNFQVFNQQLLELWQQERLLKSVPGTAGDMAKAIDSFLSQLS